VFSVRIGVIFPQSESGNATASQIKEYAQGVDALGFKHILLFDHVVGAHPNRLSSLPNAPYNHETPFQEVFVTLGFMAAVTERVELVTGITILPQRQTALVAKQTAQIDNLSGGRLRLGVGVGWNAVEAEALGTSFQDRGRRCEEQVKVLKEFWTEPLVDFKGEFHDLEQVGINPLPIQRPIPIWFGGADERVLDRMARLGDGWMPAGRLSADRPAESKTKIDEIRALVRGAGRDPEKFGFEGWVRFSDKEDGLNRSAEIWREIGATHLSINTMGMGFGSLPEHLKALERASKFLEV